MEELKKNEILDFIRSKKRTFIAVGTFTALINILMLTPSIYMLQVYDRALPSHNEITLLMLTIIAMGMFVFMGVLDYVRSMVAIRVSNQLDKSLHSRVYTAAFRNNLKKNKADAGQTVQDLSTVRQFLTGSSLFAFFDLPWFPVYLIVIFLFNTWLGIFSLCGAIVLIALAIINEWAVKRPIAEANFSAMTANHLASENLRNAEVIEAMGMLPDLKRRWLEHHKGYIFSQTQASESSTKISTLTRTVRLALQSLILGLGGWLAIKGEVSPGMMIAGSILMGRALSPIEQIISIWKSWSSTRLAYQRLNSALEQNPPHHSEMAYPPPTGHIQVEHVRVCADDHSEREILHDVSLSLAAGDVVGIIGPSAAGKSTLARLIAGIIPATNGHVRFDGVDINLWRKDDLGKYMGYLPQDIALFAGTVGENIARFQEIDPEKIISAARLAGVHELILQLPDAYDTVIGNNGAGLSGGQKQRIALARALYDEPAIVILDEPNSNLDENGEQALAKAIVELREKKKTVILVTHRTRLLSTTNKLLLLIDGKVNDWGESRSVISRIASSQEKYHAHAEPRTE
ncbi:MAG: type I secretion system permease/ATPase [Hafnia sp.]